MFLFIFINNLSYSQHIQIEQKYDLKKLPNDTWEGNDPIGGIGHCGGNIYKVIKFNSIITFIGMDALKPIKHQFIIDEKKFRNKTILINNGTFARFKLGYSEDYKKVYINFFKECQSILVFNTNNRKKHNSQVKENNNKQNIDPNEIINASSGSGFIVSSSGHIVTNNHVINGCNEVKVHYNGEKYKASIISRDSYNDLALIKANFTPSKIFTIKNGNAELMEDIYVAGYPFGDLFNSSVKITKGIVSSLSGFQNNFSNMQIDAAIQPGNSGGPVIDFQGNVVGVAVAKLDLIKFVEIFKSVPENTNFAIKSSVLINFLNSNGLITKKESEKKISRSELSETITKGTLFLSCWMTYARIEEMKTQKVLFNNIIK